MWTSEHVGEPDLRRPSLIQLRLRALVGVSARAEILKLMLADPERGQAASTVADAAGYGKGSVAQALDMLTMAGIVQVQPTSNSLVYRLSRPAELVDVLQWLPSAFPDWAPIFRITEAVSEFARVSSTTPLSRAADVQNSLKLIEPDLQRLGIADQVPRATGSSSVTEFEHWALKFLADHCGRGEGIPTASEVTYTVHHLSFGGWMATVSQRGREPVRLERDEAAPTQNEEEPSLGQIDERIGARELARAIFRDVLARSHLEMNEARPMDAVAQLISGEFAVELLRPMRPGQEATFSAEFVRRWLQNRRQRFASTA